MAKQLQEIQKENSRLKKLVADQALHMLIPSAASATSGEFPKSIRRRHPRRCDSGRGIATPAEAFPTAASSSTTTGLLETLIPPPFRDVTDAARGGQAPEKGF